MWNYAGSPRVGQNLPLVVACKERLEPKVVGPALTGRGRSVWGIYMALHAEVGRPRLAARYLAKDL